MPLDHSPPSTPQDSDAGVLPPVDTTDDAFLWVSAGGYLAVAFRETVPLYAGVATITGNREHPRGNFGISARIIGTVAPSPSLVKLNAGEIMNLDRRMRPTTLFLRALRAATCIVAAEQAKGLYTAGV